MPSRRISAALRLGVLWSLTWAPIGLLIGWLGGGNQVNPDGFPRDDWLVPMVVLGFVGGAIFSMILLMVERRHRFEQLSVWRFGAMGALGGVALGVVAVVARGLDSGWGPLGWTQAVAILAAATVMSAVSASGSLALARNARGADSLGGGEDSRRKLPG